MSLILARVDFVLCLPETTVEELREKLTCFINEACTKLENEFKHECIAYRMNAKEIP